MKTPKPPKRDACIAGLARALCRGDAAAFRGTRSNNKINDNDNNNDNNNNSNND